MRPDGAGEAASAKKGKHQERPTRRQPGKEGTLLPGCCDRGRQGLDFIVRATEIDETGTRGTPKTNGEPQLSQFDSVQACKRQNV